MRHFLAGQLAALRDLTLLYAPNINSYKRFQPGSFAPTAVAWGPDNRTCALRVIGHGRSHRLENRLPGGDVNPYLAVAGMIAAGLHGVDQRLELPEALHRERLHRRRRARAHHAARGRRALGDQPASPGRPSVRRSSTLRHMARVEQTAYDAAVTDWERFRSFERM